MACAAEVGVDGDVEVLGRGNMMMFMSWLAQSVGC
jgi:hypothetical protein